MEIVIIFFSVVTGMLSEIGSQMRKICRPELDFLHWESAASSDCHRLLIATISCELQCARRNGLVSQPICIYCFLNLSLCNAGKCCWRIRAYGNTKVCRLLISYANTLAICNWFANATLNAAKKETMTDVIKSQKCYMVWPLKKVLSNQIIGTITKLFLIFSSHIGLI